MNEFKGSDEYNKMSLRWTTCSLNTDIGGDLVQYLMGESANTNTISGEYLGGYFLSEDDCVDEFTKHATEDEILDGLVFF